MERKQFISLWLPGHSLSSRGRNSIRSLKQKPWGTMLAGWMAGLFSDSLSYLFIQSGPLGWGIAPPTVDLALLYQLVIKKMPHRYAPISFQWRIPQSFICSILDETIYLHYSLMVCPLFYNLPLCVSSQLPPDCGAPRCAQLFLVFGRLMVFWYLASCSLLRSWHSSCRLPLPVTPPFPGLSVFSSWNPPPWCLSCVHAFQLCTVLSSILWPL